LRGTGREKWEKKNASQTHDDIKTNQKGNKIDKKATQGIAAGWQRRGGEEKSQTIRRELGVKKKKATSGKRVGNLPGFEWVYKRRGKCHVNSAYRGRRRKGR